MEEVLDNTGEKQKKPVHRFQKGVSGNPKGRPKGSVSIKDKIRQHLEKNPKDVEEIIKYFVKENRELMWQMLEGRPQQDITTDGQPIPYTITIIKDGQSGDQNKGQDSKVIPGTV